MTDQIKLIVTDMDGTLLNSDHQLPNNFHEIFTSLKTRGIQFCAASGRQYPNLKETLQDYVDDVYFIAENGSLLAKGHEEIFTSPIEATLLKDLIAVARQIDNTYIVLCGKDAAYVESDDERFIDQVKQYYTSFHIVDSLEEVLENPFLKLTICDFGGTEVNSHPHFKKYENELSVKVSSNLWLDLTLPHANKGFALSKLQKQLGISVEETMAFGDYLNDLEMMDRAKFSYAMENAHPLLKEKASFSAKSNNEAGVIEVIQSILV